MKREIRVGCWVIGCTVAPARSTSATVWEEELGGRVGSVSVRLQLATWTDVSHTAPSSHLVSPSLRLSQFFSASPLPFVFAVHFSLNFPSVLFFFIRRGDQQPVTDSKEVI